MLFSLIIYKKALKYVGNEILFRDLYAEFLSFFYFHSQTFQPKKYRRIGKYNRKLLLFLLVLFSCNREENMPLRRYFQEKYNKFQN